MRPLPVSRRLGLASVVLCLFHQQVFPKRGNGKRLFARVEMSLQSVPFSRLSEVDIQRLIEGRIAESVTLDYKQQTYGKSDGDKKEFRKDISALANTRGATLSLELSSKMDFHRR
jgi:hypothetical protein